MNHLAARKGAAASSATSASRTRARGDQGELILERRQGLGRLNAKMPVLNACIRTGTKGRQLVAASGECRIRPNGSALRDALRHPEFPDRRDDGRNVVIGGAEERLGFRSFARRPQHRLAERVDAMQQDRQISPCSMRLRSTQRPPMPSSAAASRRGSPCTMDWPAPCRRRSSRRSARAGSA